MKLKQLFSDCDIKVSEEAGILDITGIAFDSRSVKPGNIFVALAGNIVDGHDFISDAVKNGTSVVVGERPAVSMPAFGATAYYQVPNSRQLLSKIAANFYGNPAKKLTVIGVTGTDGKTSTCNMISGLLRKAGFKTGLLTTINVDIDHTVVDTGVHVTTPDAVSVQSYLAQMVAAGVQYAIIEATSHGLSQHRVNDCEFDIGMITNVTHEHFDYHKDFNSYREAKSLLFRLLNRESGKDFQKYAILNADDPSYDFFKDQACVVSYSYGIKNSADFFASNIVCVDDHYLFTVNMPGGKKIEIKSKLMGIHNVYNALAAIAVTYLQNIPTQSIKDYFLNPDILPGRFEEIVSGQPFRVFVDYAHTENALQNVLDLANQIKKGRLILVFGLSGGLRDKSKRPGLGRIAELNSDLAIITAVDWYPSEPVTEIIDQIAEGCIAAGGEEKRTFVKIPDREQAIAYAIQTAKSGDVVVIAGKGHETSLSINGVEYPWNEVEVTKSKIRKFAQNDQ
ncbi:MAG: UDP-N-acetylmuramoyl-L-alanyl-D-glutamate--2,6-diaminopimelate ligase [Brevefilum fermentans]|jgi:UDP-N-acetylmuramoyl-L-alanyl-D-glutamate--2,6-diaminopimelate ligase|nr:UDP-N-acetylmuramoyl-L-alanyl-D-glutamate--2,6-diaminopimelate ligase [Brevefilum fermentans]